MRYSISNWSGRLGNNIQQVANAIMLAESLNHTFEQKLDHDIIEKFEYNFGTDGKTYESIFYNWQPQFNCVTGTYVGDNEVGIPKEYIYRNMKRVCSNYIFSKLKIPIIDSFDEDTLVIHIRNGDIFVNEKDLPINYISHYYVQNPLSYYLFLIQNFKNVIVVYEPTEFDENPVIGELKKISKLKFQSLSVVEDYATLLAAKNLATSGLGTFAISAALCSQNIKNLFTSNLFITEQLNYTMFDYTDVNVFEIKLENYIPVFPPSWRHSKTQRDFMLKYELPKINLNDCLRKNNFKNKD